MKKDHREVEKSFYENAYNNPETRIQRGFSWETTPSPSMIQLFKKVQSEIPIDACVLDIGIGADGRNAKYFLEQGYSVVGIDISRNALKYCAQVLAGYSSLVLQELDMSKVVAMSELGEFDLIIDWSVMKHIRRAYLPIYKANILKSLKVGGYLISTQFADPMPEKFKAIKGKDYCLWKGHYMRRFTVGGFISEFPTLNNVSYLANCPEEKVHGIKFHSVLFKKQ